MEPLIHDRFQELSRASRDAQLLQAIDEFEIGLRSGKPIARQDLLDRYSAVRAELEACLAGLELVHRAGRSPAIRSAAGAFTGAPVELGDFRILREVGRGGMGIVYEAEQLSLGRRVALKVLPFAAVLDPKQVERFQKEARAAALLHHTSIVPVFTVGCEDGVHFYAMQFIDGKSLRDVIESLRARRRKHPASLAKQIRSRAYFRTVAKLGLQAAEALEHAHSKGVVHRDVKPSNLLLDRRQNLWVADFGLARVEGDHNLSVTGDLVGTLRYMSPEQASSAHGGVSPLSDVYSLGVTLHELLTLEPAFGAKERERLVLEIAAKEPARPSHLNGAVPKDLETVVLKAMAKNPRQRYGSAHLMAEDLRRFLMGRPVLARRQAWALRAAKWCARRKLAIGCGAAIIIAFALTGTVLHQRGTALELRNREIYRQKILDGISLLQSGRRPGVGTTTYPVPDKSERSHHACSQCPGGGLLAWFDTTTGTWPSSINPLEAAATLFHEAAELFPDRPDAHYYRARSLALLGRNADAIGELDSVLAVDPGSAPAVHLKRKLVQEDGSRRVDDTRPESAPANPTTAVGMAWAEVGDALRALRWKEAIVASSKALAAIEEGGKFYEGLELELRLARGIARLETRDYVGAIEDLGIARTLAPHLPLPAVCQAEAYYLSGNTSRAEEIFERAYQFARPRDAAALCIASRYEDLGDHERGLAWARRAKESAQRASEEAHQLFHLGRAEESLEVARKGASLAPESGVAHRRVAMALAALGRREEAVAAMWKAVEAEPSSAAEHFNLGTYLLELHEFPGAEKELLESIRLDPNLANPYHNLGRVYVMMDRLDEALSCFTKCLEVNPSFAEAEKTLHSMAQTLEARGRVEEAIAKEREAVLRAPGQAYLRTTLASQLCRLGKLKEALAEADEALKLDPRSADGHTIRAVALDRLDQLDEAARGYEKAIELDPKRSNVLMSLGILHARKGEHERAAQCFLRAQEIDPADPSPSVNLGYLFNELLRFDDAAVHFRKALELEPRQPEPALWLLDFGRCLVSLGKVEEAEQIYRKGIATLEQLPADQQVAAAHSPLEIPFAHEFLSNAAARRGDRAEARALMQKSLDTARRMAERPSSGSRELNNFAWSLLTCELEDLRDAKSALPLAEKANALAQGKDLAVLDTLALACFLTGDATRAADAEEAALRLLPPPAPGDEARLLPAPMPPIPVAELRQQVEQSLKKFRAVIAAENRGPPRAARSRE